MKNVLSLFLIQGLCLAISCSKNGSGDNGELTLLSVEGGTIVNKSGEEVNFKGLVITNESWGDWEWPTSDELEAAGEFPFLPQKKIPDHTLTEEDFENIKEISPPLIRYELSYNVFNPDNPLRNQNMERLKKDVEHFNSSGIYVVLVLHYGPGLNLARAEYENKKDGVDRTPTIFENSAIFERHAAWWEYVAAEFRENSGIAAYQIYVEPRIPAESDGGWAIFEERTIELCNRITAVDPTHVLVVHYPNSREANPGEQYWDSVDGKMVTDAGEQGIIWREDSDFISGSIRIFPLVDLPNIVYAFSAYTPYSFCSEGADKDYDGKPFDSDAFKAAMQSYVKPFADFGEEHNVPILVDEYGVNQQQTVGARLEWLKAVHEVFDSFGLPSWFYQYKGAFDPSNGSLFNYGIYSYFVFDEFRSEFVISDTDYTYIGEAGDEIYKNGFDDIFRKYFWDSGTVKTLSLTDNKELHDYMKAYLK